MEQRQWQSVEIPLSAFYPLEEPIESIRLFGNLRGTFYLDDVILLAQVGPTQPTAVVETHDEITPAEVSLDPNFPNPFNSGTLIRFSLAHISDIELAIYNLAGQKSPAWHKARALRGSTVLPGTAATIRDAIWPAASTFIV